jgi:dihydroneopterin aldolase
MKRNTALTRISVTNAEFYGYHGVREEERNLGGRYQVDIDVWCETVKAVVSYDISDSVNYEELLFIANEVMTGEPCELIETLAYDIGSGVMDRFSQVRQATIRVRKLSVPIQAIFDYVETEITITREG